MKTFTDSVAVVTGAASGIGLALAKAAQARGAKLVLADIRADALRTAERQLMRNGEVLSVPTDVADDASVDALATAAVARFGKVNVLFNNAGVYATGVAWNLSLQEYDWVIGVNQKSVINGIRSFVPRMIAQRDSCHIVTTSSAAGLLVGTGGGGSLYSMTKHAIVALTEALYLDLASENISNIGVTLVMPGFVQSDIMSPEKSCPQALQGEVKSRLDVPRLRNYEAYMREGVAHGLPAAALAEEVFGAIVRNDLYVLPAATDEMREQAKAIAIGRLTGKNAYSAKLAATKSPSA